MTIWLQKCSNLATVVQYFSSELQDLIQQLANLLSKRTGTSVEENATVKCSIDWLCLYERRIIRLDELRRSFFVRLLIGSDCCGDAVFVEKLIDIK